MNNIQLWIDVRVLENHHTIIPALLGFPIYLVLPASLPASCCFYLSASSLKQWGSTCCLYGLGSPGLCSILHVIQWHHYPTTRQQNFQALSLFLSTTSDLASSPGRFPPSTLEMHTSWVSIKLQFQLLKFCEIILVVICTSFKETLPVCWSQRAS